MFSWQKYRHSFTEEAARILHTLTLEEKISLMSGKELKKCVRGAIQNKQKIHYNEFPYCAGGLEEKKVPELRFADGTRGVVCGVGKATCFPVTVMRGASFDPELEEKVGEMIAEEVLDAGGNLFGGVCVNVPYHPGWGRAQESYGEDPCLLAVMGSALVRGVQKKGVIACVKHFAFNSMENARFKVSVSCSRRAEREVFLPQFKACIDAGAGAVMSAYNSYRNIPCGHHDYLLNQVLKKEWGFDGFVMDDFLWGIRDTVSAVNGGMDLEMPSAIYFGERLLQAVKEGRVKEERIDDAALRIIRTLLAHEQMIRMKKGQEQINYEKHRKLARICAREGMTLIRNENHLLPFSIGKRRKKIVVLGYLADKENIGDKGSSQVFAPYVVSALEGIADYSSYADVTYYPGERASHCRRLAAEADLVIIVAGNDYSDEGECVAKEGQTESDCETGGDRVDGIGLKERDLSVIRAVCQVRDDAVVVLIGGSTIVVNEWQEKVGAILVCYYPGMEGGAALADVLFGKTEPGGKLPFVIPEKEEDLVSVDWNTDEIIYEYCHGYTLLQKTGKKPAYPFGFGLSYTTFQIDEVQAVRKEDCIFGCAVISNTGKRKGSQVVQMYAEVKAPDSEKPLYVLKAFQKVRIRPGVRKKVILKCNIRDLDFYDANRGAFVSGASAYHIYIGTSSAPEDLIKCRV